MSRYRDVGTRGLFTQTALVLASMAAFGVQPAIAQRHGGGGAGHGDFGGGMPGHMSEGGMRGGIGDRGGFVRSAPDIGRSGPRSSMHTGLQLGPPVRWWDDKHFVKQLHLSDDQQHHLDSIFEQNKGTLIKRYETLQQEEQRMDTLTHAKTLDEPAMFAQIDRIEQARADVWKATTHYLVQLRGELNQDQISKLEDQH